MRKSIYPGMGIKIEEIPGGKTSVSFKYFGDVQITKLPCTFGGVQRFFLCPKCGRRRGISVPLDDVNYPWQKERKEGPFPGVSGAISMDTRLPGENLLIFLLKKVLDKKSSN